MAAQPVSAREVIGPLFLENIRHLNSKTCRKIVEPVRAHLKLRRTILAHSNIADLQAEQYRRAEDMLATHCLACTKDCDLAGW